jgi:hypothetical protein
MTLDEPRMGLLLGVRPPDPLVALCRELAKWIPIGDGRDGGTYDVILWRPADPAGPEAHPYVLYAEDNEAIDAYSRNARLVLVARSDLFDHALQAARRTRFVPGHPDGAETAVPVAPFVRARVRASRGLDEHAIAEHGDGWMWQGRPVDNADELLDTMLGLASVVVTVWPSDAIRALAWGAPLVTSPETARLIGAKDGIQCLVVADQRSRRERAAEVVSNIRLAARLSWHGRMLYEQQHSLRACCEAVLSAVDMRGTWSPSSLTTLLGELGTPPSAHIVDRVKTLVGPVVRPLPLWRVDLT